MAKRILGSGKLYWDEDDANGDPTGEVYLAETPGIAMPISTENFEAWSADNEIAEKVLDVPTKVDRGFNFELIDMALSNLALFLIGSVATVTQTTTPLVADPINGGKGVTQGRYYQLGVSVNPAGLRGMTAVAIKDGATPMVLTTDYTLDAALGRIYIVPGGGISDNTVLTADLTPDANTREQLTTDQLGAKTGRLRYVANNTSGANSDMFIPKVTLTPEGEFALKSRDTLQKMSFSASVSTRTGSAQVYIDGRPT